MIRGKRTFAGTTADIFLYLITGLFTIMCIYPFWYILIYAISDPTLVNKGVYIIPQGLSLFNFKAVMQLKGLWQALFMSILRTVSGTVITVMCCSFLAYLFTKQEMPFRSTLYRMLIITMYASGGLIPEYLINRSYGLYNNFLVYIVPGAVSAMNVVLIKTFIESLSPSLEESAIIDGAGYTRLYWSIVLPLSKPIIATISVFAAVAHWNDFMTTHIYTTPGDTSLYTLQYLLYRFVTDIQRYAADIRSTGSIRSAEEAVRRMVTEKGVQITATLITTIPIFLVYPFAQRYFVKGIMMGAIKG